MTWEIGGKTVLITGGNAGVGREAAIALAREGARVLLTSRDEARGREALSDVRSASGNDTVRLLLLDLASFASIRACAAEVLDSTERLDVLINNAGLMLDQRRTTVEGFEMTFGVNHLGHYLLTCLLLDHLRASTPARIINVSSDAHRASLGLDFDDLQRERRYSTFPVYSDSKLANILFTRALARRLAGTGVTANALHPGVIASRFGRDGDVGGLFGVVLGLGAPFLATPAKGARTSVYLATAPDLSDVTGEYFVRRRRRRPSPAARDAAAAERLWLLSEELVAKAERSPDTAS